jgi:hypothetical protein
VSTRSDGQITRTSETEANYRDCWKRLRNQAGKALKIHEPSPSQVALWLVSHVPAIRQNTLRLYRAAASFCLVEARDQAVGAAAQDIEIALDIVGSLRPRDYAKTSTKTSARKPKEFPIEMSEAIFDALANSTNQRETDLCLFLRGALIAGPRPVEWARSSWTYHPDRRAGTLRFINAKATNGRAHSEHRTLIFLDATEQLNKLFAACTARGRELAGARDFSDYMNDLQDLLRETFKRLFPRRRTFPTFYSARHHALAEWKAAYMFAPFGSEEFVKGAAIVAAMAGHASDATATHHYGRKKRGKGPDPSYSIPYAHPDEVEKVRPRLLAALSRMTAEPAAKMKKPGLST